MKLITNFFRAISLFSSRLAVWFTLVFFSITSNVFATDYTITVTAAGNSDYIFNSSGLQLTDSNDPDISVNVGDKLIFDVTSNTLATHPFAIVSQLNSSNGYSSSNEVSGVINNGENGVTITWDLTGVTPGEYYYVCVNHPNMRGKITVNAVTSGTDSDSDGVPDAADLDDDNDGITDVLEGGQTLDTDGDGIPNRLDLDSDGDNCNDVVEAGYVDGDNDGIVGVSPYIYTSEGLVNNETYKNFEGIDDLDANGTKDFLERGTALSKTKDPVNVIDIEYSTVTFTGGGATVGNVGTITYSWQITTDNGDTWTNVSKYITDNADYPGIYSGIDSTTLVIDSITSDMDKFSYRLYMQTPAFKCDQDVTTNDAQLRVYKKDTDGDKIPDELDADDDNDGITDVNEGGEDLDTDGDGIPNRLDLDSDDDGCNDVIEAGFTDENGDGKVGIPVLIVNSTGLVTSHGEGLHTYGTPPDLDNNGVYDFLESASAATIDSSPTDATIRSNGKAIFIAKGTSDGTIEYTWQVSTDAGDTFTDIEQYDNKGEQSEVMIVGGGFPRFDNHKAFIELYANTDISSGEYRLYMYDQSGSARYLDITFATAGQYIYIYESNQINSYFGDNLTTLYGGSGNYRQQRWSNIDNFSYDNRFELVKVSDNTVVDRYGEDTNSSGVDEPYPWVTPYGFFKRKDSIFASSEFNETDWIICNGCLDASTNDASSTPYTLGDLELPSTAVYSGYDDDTLVIHAAPRNFDRHQYRAKIRTVNYACDNGSFTDAAELFVFLDTDGDGVGDADDLDDDNDGILDTEEGSSTDDYDGDGIPNRLDLDSDGDGCNDVIEAGFTDADGDGVPGNGAPTVGTDGKIIGHSYEDPQDANSNNVDDFLETSYDAGIYTHPTSIFADEEDDTIFVSQATLQTRFTFFNRNEPNNNNYNYAYMNSNNYSNSGWMDFIGTSALRSVVEFDSLTQETISGLIYMFQHRGHSYYYHNSTKTFDNAVTFAQNAGGYLVVINDTYEAELVRENVRKQSSNVSFWINHYRDSNAEDYVQSTYATGWVSGYIPNADITYQWQVGVISGSDTTWTDVTNGTNYAGADNDTLRVKAIPANFDKNLFRLKASPKGNACTAGPAYSDPAQLTVSSDPDGDGIKNSVDLDDDNDGILDTEEGGKTLDTDGDGIPNRLDLDSDGDGCLDAEEAGFTGFDSDGRLCADSNCAGSDGKVTGHSYDDPLDGDNSGKDDYLEFGYSPTITSDLNNQVIIANGSSSTLTVNTTIAGINSPALSYTNWNGGEPNNSGGQQFAQMLISNGKWGDLANNWYYNQEVVEFNTPRDDEISGYTKLMDDYNGHSYYMRNTQSAMWTRARDAAKDIGGYLVVIDSEVENQLVWEAVRAKATNRNIWIGLYQNTSSENYFEPSGGWEWVDQPSTVSYTWQVSTDSTNWTNITDANYTVSVNDTSIVYSNYESNALSVDPVINGINGYQYRVIASNPGFKCVVADTSNITTLVVRDDFDGDGIRDDVDVDDDNDGILDQYEGNGSLDTDGDGMPNTKDLDSDNDGCYDVDEAYGTSTDRDSNDDGILGGANPTINSDGSVSGYNNTQLDQDGNGVKDFLEAGSAITDMSCPDDLTVAEGSDIEIITSATGQGETSVSYIWQISEDSTNWTDVSDVELMFIGMGEAQYATTYGGQPGFIELVALKDIPNLNKYRVYQYSDSNTSYSYYSDLSGSAKKGDIILLYYNFQFDNFFTKKSSEYDRAVGVGDLLYRGMNGGDDSFVLVDGNKNQNNDVVDMIGRRGEDGTDKSWDYYKGWMKRKPGSFPRKTFNEDDWIFCKECFLDKNGERTYKNSTSATPYSQSDYEILSSFDESKGDTLIIENIDQSINGYQFRAIASTPSYVCGDNDTTCAVTITVVPDNDRDGIPDATDLDDDNDGILDTVEGEDTDTDGDGILDKYDLDSDGDGCKDVQEAGFSDPDGDGVFGESTPIVGTDGKIVGHDYATPADADGNGNADYLEVGSTVSINSYRDYFLSEGNDTAMYFVNYSITGTTKLHWQVSTDNGTTWADIDAGDNGTATSGDTEVCTNSNWGSAPWNWTEGSLENTLTNIGSGTDMTIKVNQNTDVEWDAGYPKIETSAFGGVKTLGLSVNPKSGSGESAMTTTITFSNAVNGISMLVTDIDSKTDGWKDKVVITSDAGNPSADSLNTNPSFSIDGNTLTAKDNIESNGDNLGTARLTFPDGVKTITIVYSDVSGIDDPDSRGIGFTFENICVNTGSASYEGVYNDTLNIYDIRQGMDEWRYRLRIATPAYVCQDTVFSQPARLDVVSDFDNDGVLNSVDLDDDNDGILDTDEGEGDLDGDGIKNRFDLDSDGDGCYDVTEAGFTDKILDANADGILGDNQPYTVDSLGRITSGLLNDGYSTPNDLDENGQMDFLQFGQNILNAVLNSSSLQMLASGSGSFKITASVPSNDKILFQWQESRDGGTSWFNIPETAPYSGTTTTELTLTQPDVSLTGYKYRVLLTIPSYVCAVMPLDLNADLTVYPDNDKDGVRDSQDQDDDNDGILDSYEGNGDNDQDGIPNRFDTDADGDGCDDVLEAGFLDANGDGLIGPDTVTTIFIDSLNSLGSKAVSTSGRVNSFGGYGVPADLDGNGTYDFLEEGAPITDVECPDSVTVAEGVNAIFSGNATVESGTVKYQWEISKDSGTTWSNITESGLMFVGLGQGYFYSNESGRPKFIELMATKDIDDLSEYRLQNHQNGTTGVNYNYTLSGSIKKGQMILLYYDSNAFNGYFNTNVSTGYAKIFAVGDLLRLGLRDGDDAFSMLWNKADGNTGFNTTTDVVDMVGIRGEDGTGKDWEYRRGWMKRKNNKAPKSTFNVNDWTVCEDCLGTVNRNADASTPYVLRTYSTNQLGSGSTTNTLTLKNVTYDDYHGAIVRVKVSTPAYACGEADTSCVARISVIPIDSDGDGVADRFDSDDDNDGILDEDEGGEDLDTDGDGIPNRLDDDSDGDGCLDVLEGGFEDPDGDGVIGSGTPEVDDLGKVDGHDYDTPADADEDGTKDFLQVSTQAVITSHPISIVRQGGDNGEFSATVTGDPTITYQWQVSEDDTLTWTDIEDGGGYSGVNTTTLTLTGLTEDDFDGLYYRLKVVTPALACADPVHTNAAFLVVKDDSDGDGIDNAFDLDSDNDGILNTVEGATADTDGDGTPDYLDLDSDGDGCYDVVEAGYDDPDGDGRPGSGDPNIIPGIGLVDVNGHDYGITDEHDSDENGVLDFKEAGGPITSLTNPSNVVSSQGKVETFTTSGTAISVIAYQWQTSEDNGKTWTDLTNTGPYSGTDAAELKIDPVSTTMNSNLFRAILSTPGFACGENDTTQSARLIALPDNDLDGIQDLYDEDDDNDGILDVDEFIDDLDGDGIPNSFDLDSDGDGCFDAVEAGFLDPNGDGILGDSVDTNGDGIKDKAANVNSSGRVTSGTGYSTPDDLDENGVKDYLEAGSQAIIDLQPIEENAISEFSDFELIVGASSDAILNYQWQVSDDCETWTDLNESPALMITGVFETKDKAYYGIELYAVRDIENLNKYGISTSNGTTGSSPQRSLNNTSLGAGQYYILYGNNLWTNFFSDENSASYKSQYMQEVYNMSNNDRHNIALYDQSSGSWKKIDIVGDHSKTAAGSDWDVAEGWLYRKNGRAASTTYTADDWNIEKNEFSLIGGTSTNGNDIVANGYPLFKFSGPSEFRGVNSDTLTIVRTPLSYNDKNFRVLVTTPGFQCDTTVASVCANLAVEAMSDTDGDGVPDYVDLDSDNDGIPDIVEGCDVDTDGDGTPNCLDLDSDGDGCNDVIEAGFTDDDGDGFLGPEDVFVDVSGLVSSGTDGYSDPNDLDFNGVNDYVEAGDTVNIITNPSTVNVLLFEDTIFVGSGTSPSIISQRWQQSDDGGETFRSLRNTPSLIITGVMEADRSSQRPKLIEFKAIRDVDCLKDYRIKIGSSYYTLGGSSCKTLEKGDFYYVVYTTNDAYGFLLNSGPNGDFNLNSYKYDQWSSLNSLLSGSTDVILEFKKDGSSTYSEVDRVEGTKSTDTYNRGWKYKKDTTQVATYFRSQDWINCSECLISEYTNDAAGSGSDDYRLESNGDTTFYSFPVASYGSAVVITGVNSDTLRIENIPYSMNEYKYNLEMQTPGFACDPDVSTDVSTLNVFLPDFDNDGYVDKLDLDADNDGILDVYEDTTDIDGDGFPNYIDLDSDGDGCFDAVEAGFTDPDNDGYLGTTGSGLVVDEDGKVVGQGGYSTPSALDLDGNGVMDYKEAGSQVTITRQPNDQIYYDDKSKFFVEASADGVIAYQWQILEDTSGEEWSDLENGEDFTTVTTDTLNVDNILEYSDNKFRVMLTTPGFACGDTVYSNPVAVINSEDWDEDGIPDNIDLDDDNDGILDILEGEDIDTDGDGIPNSKDTDSDGDGCYDAVEAGYTDEDDDGYLGTSPFEVTTVGTVIGNGGYQPPEDDLDDNGIIDLLEVGSAAVPNTIPVNDTLIAGENASFTGSFTAEGTVTYKWEYSAGKEEWVDVPDTLVIGEDTTYFSGINDTTLNITNVTFAMNDYRFRIVANTPSFKCGPDMPSIPGAIKLAGDNDQDGIIDIIDLDDDNDGILDSIEGGGDTDGDGIPDWFDLDSDGDGCYDVQEAGFEDPDNDGVLCTSPVVVDRVGKVVCLVEGACEDDPNTNMSWNRQNDATFISDSERSPGYYRLTSSSIYQWGTIFRNRSPNYGRVDLRGDFEIEADLYFGTNVGEGRSGIAFNLVGNANYASGNWAYFVSQYDNALTVEFDTHYDGGFDIANDHSSLHINGNNIAGTNTLGVTQNFGYNSNQHIQRPINIVDLGQIEDGEWKTFKFIWRASSKTVIVDFEGEQIMTYQVDLIKDVFNGSNLAFLSFAADNYNSNQEHRVYLKRICEVSSSSGEPIFKGYKEPSDLDEDGVFDFQQKGDVPEFSESYEDDDIVIIKEGADTTFTTSVTYEGTGDVVWQMCNEDCSECTIIEKSPGIMMTGIFRGDIGGIEPSVIELYALEDIADLSVYGIEIARDGSAADGQEYALSAVSLDSGEFYTVSSNDLYHKSWFSNNPSQQSFYNNFDGDDAIVLYKNDTIVDVFGTPGKDGSGELWDYTLGWAYRKDGRIYSSTFNLNDWKTCRGCSLGSNSNNEMVNPFPLSGFAGAPTFEDVDTDNLTLKNATATLDGVRIRRAVLDPAYACLPESGGDCIRVGIFLDNDKDGIIDEIDLDDDNDGILDTLETEGDTDGDGIPNHFDLDSDNDGCYDAVEAGFTDGDDDGILGDSPVTVDSLGMVTSGVDGYTLPADNDGSGGYDFLEFGTVAVLVSSPDTTSGTEGSDLYFVAKGTAVGGSMTSYPFDYQDWTIRNDALWESSSDRFRLTLESNYRTGQIWNTSKIQIDRGFVISSDMNFGMITDNGARGIAFVLQNVSTSAYGSHSGNFGYSAGNISNAFAVEIDTRPYGDNLSANSIRIVSLKNNVKTVIETKDIPSLKDGTYNNVSISWDPNTKVVTIFLNGQKIVSGVVNLSSEIFGSTSTYFGFTSATGAYTNYHYIKNISLSGTLQGDESGNVIFDWQVSSDSAATWVDITEADSLIYRAVKNDTLFIDDASKELNGYVYRAKVRNPAFACDPGTFSQIALLEILPDNDKDGIPDDIDVDDDNDGILDTKEGTDDLDGDGIPNHFDLDSDGDGCLDVTEAGFDDNDFVYTPYDTIVEDVFRKWYTTTAPNNSGGNQHYGYIVDTTGFEDVSNSYNIYHILEISEPFTQNFSGYTYLGDYNGHAYYRSTSTSIWTQAKAKADAIPGGYLAVVTTQEELNWIYSRYSGYMWVGLYQDLEAENYSEPDSGWVNVSSISRSVVDTPDGILGNSPVKVDDLGRVIQSADGTTSQGYFKPKDGDANGVEDYREVGSAAVITLDPVTDRVDGGDTIVLGTVVEVIGTAVYEWYESRDSGKVWIKLPPFAPYSGVDTDTLSILGAPLSMNGYQYKMVVSTPAFACGENDTTATIPIRVSNDNDEDGIPNEIDIDDDNDGIVDTLEVVDSENDDDFDNDGIPNHYDLDSDNDGCLDVLEAGFNDPDGDGILGISPVVVNNIGQVLLFDTNGDGLITPQDTVVADTVAAGYITPLDADSTDVFDFKEEDDFIILFNTHPADIQVPDKTDAYMFVDVAAEDSIVYQWYSSKDTLTWTMVEDDTIYIERENEVDVFDTLIFRGATSDTLFILGADTLIDSTYYRVVVNIPSQPCADETTSNAALYTVVTDIDLDNDGIPNVEEGYGDLDGDGIPNYLDLDSDNDGIPDVIEGGDGVLDTNGDGMIDENDEGFSDDDEDGMADASEETPAPDTDGDGAPDYLDIDSDNDGIFDVVEGGDGDLDTNGDGMIDENDEGFADEDNDGMADASEDTDQPDYDGDGRPDYLDIDSDNDGIFDVEEGGSGDLDTNDDGVIDENDEGYSDEDNDGMDDDSETTPAPDTDGDSLPDYLDLDSDNDGIHDIIEGGDSELDTNNDGVIDENDDGYADEDGDGMDDSSEETPAPDTDNDGRPDFQDIDSDNDGIFDVVEGGDGKLDTNNDGVIDENDTGFTDVDEDGMDDDSETTPVTDSDEDGTPDYQDIDSDNDGIFDVVEGGDGELDTNNDGVIDENDDVYVDEDNDGMDDTAETTDVKDYDGDETPDYLDIDSDNDGIFDVEEGGDGDSDTNDDGRVDSSDEGYTDLDADGMDDDTESTNAPDTDLDGNPNYNDIDSDDDGIFDVEEGGDGDLDINEDGVIDSNDDGYSDEDNDGMDDSAEETTAPDNDGDTTPNYLDIDSDNDGIQDVVEGGDGDLDTNGDGQINANDEGHTDEDGDGMDDDAESTPVTHTDGDELGDGVPDYLDIDSDNDGIFDVVEGGDGALDTNNDGVLDINDENYLDLDDDGMFDPALETNPLDSDGDETPDYLDLDSDNDGIFDVVEGGDGALDVDGDGVIGCNCSEDNGYTDENSNGMNDTAETTTETNTDGDDLPDYLDIDSDNDGIQDVVEGGDSDLDTNGDGVIDANDEGYEDADGDGMDDSSETTEEPDTDGDQSPDFQDIDSDNDGVFDVVEGGDADLDINVDGVIDENDENFEDSDNNGMDDASELTDVTNSDTDTTPDFQDIDSDNDGIFDVVEGGDGDLDTNGDGAIDDLDDTFVDADGNGMDDSSEETTEPDSDGDGNVDYLDLDSDNDGIFDVEEGGDGSLDLNGDGTIDAEDGEGYSDLDQDGMDDDAEPTPVTETDGDSLPDYLDIDSDNDGIQDVIEGGDGEFDTNGDGVIDSNDEGYADEDGDGMDDSSETTPVTESDNDQLPDYQDIDSDNDGIFDVVEGGDGVLDTDNNGVVNSDDEGFVDEDDDGMEDNAELTGQTNSDGDTNPDYIDIDSDNDGIHDVTESGDGVYDTNNDGAIDSLDDGYTDTDNDGMDDDSETTDPFDSDGDSLPNHLDLDSDNDGIYDVDEGGDSATDTNDDGVIDTNDDGYTDIDGDGMDDDSESTPVVNTDQDNNPDFVDIDSDNDGIQDVIEGGDGEFDTNGDGRIDSLDNTEDFIFLDEDGDGMADLSEDTPTPDTDEDGAYDYQDLDADNDGIFDVIEGGDGIDADFDEDGVNEFADLDTNNDGMIDSDDEGYVDADNDGMADQSEGTGQPNSDVTEDLDDGIPNYLDLDSDDDGCNDIVEAGFPDLDGDGILGVGIPEIDGSGLVITEDDEGYEVPVDSDNNGILDCYDALVLVVDIDSQPQYAGTVFQGDEVSYAVGVTVDGDLPAEFQWQRGVVSDDEQDTTWTDLENGLDYTGVDTDSMTINTVTFDDDDNTLYRVKVTARGYKCAFVLSDPVVLDVKFRDLHIPQGFSPNYDGTNDTWVITGIDFYPNSTVQIYNRWELKVFEMEGYENEDPSKYFEGIANFGNTSGKLLPETVYFYVIDLGDTDIDGNAVEEDNRYRKGFVYIRRGNE